MMNGAAQSAEQDADLAGEYDPTNPSVLHVRLEAQETKTELMMQKIDDTLDIVRAQQAEAKAASEQRLRERRDEQADRADHALTWQKIAAILLAFATTSAVGQLVVKLATGG